MRNADRMQLDAQRCSAARFFVENYSREKRHLIYLSRESGKYLSSKEYILQKDLEHQFYFDFLIFFEELKDKMKEFRWSKEFLLENGIDFVALKKLYFAVA